MVTTVISGAQTGADRAGLDVAIALGIMTGGWIPKGRRTEEGTLSWEDFRKYRLTEHSSWAYPPRTKSNVIMADATVLFGNMGSSGSKETIGYCIRHYKPYFPWVEGVSTAAKLRAWLETNGFQMLNVAGNRESKNPGIYRKTYDHLMETLR